jgi:beta-glucanase (GH16 family)
MSGTTSSSFDVVLADDFSQGYKVENWGNPFNGGTYWNGMFQWSDDDVAVRDGTMQVTVTRHADGSWTTGGFNSFKAGKAITYGKIEFDGKVEESQGTMGVFLTWPLSDDNWPANGEIDILETPGQDVMHTTHWQGQDGNHYYDSVRNQSYDETQWNHYELLWLPDVMTLKVNGQVVAEWTDPEEIPDVAHGIGAMGMVASANDGWMGGPPDGSTPDVTTIYMDNVVMSQWNGGPITPGPDPVTPPDPVVIAAGSGPDTLELKISQDAYQGSAQYKVFVDGAQVGGTFTASAWRSAGESDTLTLKGDWAAGAHAVEVKFLQDAWGGSAAADRNLHVDGATYNGAAVEGAAQAILTDTTAGAFSFTEAAPPVEPEPPISHPPVTLSAGSGPDALVLKISQDVYQGDAQYQVFVDGAQVGGTFSASALHARGESDTLTLKGDWAAGAHAVEVRFLNDAWGGSAATDRNLHVDGASFNGAAVEGAAQVVWGDSQPGGFSFIETADPTPAPSPVVETGTAGADMFDATEVGAVFTGGGGRDLFVFDAGDGPVTVTDFASKTDKLVFVGFERADVSTAAATQGGKAGLMVAYGGEDGGTVFLEGVASLAAKDMIFA